MSKYEFVNHVIDFINEKQSFYELIYNLNEVEFEILRRYIEYNLRIDFIRLFILSARLLILFIRKLNGDLHFYVNYRELNIIIIKNHFFFL